MGLDEAIVCSNCCHCECTELSRSPPVRIPDRVLRSSPSSASRVATFRCNDAASCVAPGLDVIDAPVVDGPVAVDAGYQSDLADRY